MYKDTNIVHKVEKGTYGMVFLDGQFHAKEFQEDTILVERTRHDNWLAVADRSTAPWSEYWVEKSDVTRVK